MQTWGLIKDASVRTYLADALIAAITISAATITKTTENSSGTDTNAYTFTNQNIGTAGADRHVIVGAMVIFQGGTGSFSSITIGGNTATISVQSSTSGGNASGLALAILSVPAGTTATIVVNTSVNCFKCGIVVYEAHGLASATATATFTDITSPFSQSLSIPSTGIGVGAGIVDSNTTATWTGLTETTDFVVENACCTSAALAAAGAAQNPTVTVTYLTGLTSAQMIGAAWG